MPGTTPSADLADIYDQHGAPPPAVPARAVIDIRGDLLRALSAPLRMPIVPKLCHFARCVHELVGALDAPQPLVGQHLRVLKAAGVVASARSGREVRYRLVDHSLADIVLAAVTHAAESP